MDSDQDHLVLNRAKHKRKPIVSSDEDKPTKKQHPSPPPESTPPSHQPKEELKQEEPPKTMPKSTPPKTTSISRPKNNIVYDILKRWWYCMDDWPPAEYDYEGALHKLDYRPVASDKWAWEEEYDQQGRAKVYSVPGYMGVYRNHQGQTVDVRPPELCPSFENLKQKSLRELFELLLKAYSNQIAEYQSLDQEEQDPKYLAYLQNQLRKTTHQQKSLLDKIQLMKKVNEQQ